MEENKTYRIRTEVGQNTPSTIDFKLDQKFDMMEILSLKIGQENLYHMPKSNYGVIVGRVLANKGFGVPNAKISVFIRKDDNTLDENILYNYTTPFGTNNDGVRYNLLSEEVDKECHQDVGTMFTKRRLLDNNTIIEVFEKYYKYTTSTNNSGDYFLSGIPTGMQQIHMDLDLSDCGILSQTPRDMIYKGYNINQFESTTKFKKSTNLNSLAQIISQNKSVFVYPFWGDTSDDTTNSTITRCDIDVDYEFEPTCIFMGSVITDTGEASISKKCLPDEQVGKMSNMVTGEGVIEMIRKTVNGKVEEYSIKGRKLIDGNGVWCYQIPMNLDYVTMDEFGNTVASDNPKLGIATRTRVRFRISMDEMDSDETARKRARYLVPNNPKLETNPEYYPEFNKNHEFDYEFGSPTADENFRDLYWNKVYTVKNYIPRLQKNSSTTKKKFTGIKGVNHYGDNNPMPYNNLSIKFNFAYRFTCMLIEALIKFIYLYNVIASWLGIALFNMGKALYRLGYFWRNDNRERNKPKEYNGDDNTDDNQNDVDEDNGDNDNKVRLASLLKTAGCRMMRRGMNMCVAFKSEVCESATGIPTKYYPGMSDKMQVLLKFEHPEEQPANLTEKNGKLCIDKGWLKEYNLPIVTDLSLLFNCIENYLAEENEVIYFNFHNDWINGVLYFPLWLRVVKPKRKFFFNTIPLKAKDRYCTASSSVRGARMKLFHPCAPARTYNTSTNTLKSLDGESIRVKELTNPITKQNIGYINGKNEANGYRFKSHKKQVGVMLIDRGIIVERETKLGQHVYYYNCGEYKEGSQDAFQPLNDTIKMLFATDIVLLGSLDNCDADGVPQFFKQLESTTYNMPPTLLSMDYETDDEVTQFIREDAEGYNADGTPASNLETESIYQTGDVDTENDEIMEGIKLDTIRLEYTGADWGNSSYDQFYNKFVSEGTLRESINTFINSIEENNGETKPLSIPLVPGGELYDNGGLFYGITCNSSYVKPKSCINMIRQCEFGVMLDQAQDIPDINIMNGLESDYDNYGTLLPDGFISYDEIYNHDGRSMFATLNNNLLKYKYDERTGYKKMDLRHMYIDNFDGSLTNLMSQVMISPTRAHNWTPADITATLRNYVNNFVLEKLNQDYLKFRFGSNNYYYIVSGTYGSHNIHVNNRIPQYENSFYFYFGLKEGKTAIDKFRSEFYSECTNDGNPELLIVRDYKPNSWCSDIDRETHDGYLLLYIKEIDKPYNLLITNLSTNETITITGIEFEKIYLSRENIESLDNDGYYKLSYTIEGDSTEYYSLFNGRYLIEIVDANNEVQGFDINYTQPNLTFRIAGVPFSKTNEEIYTTSQITYDSVASDTNAQNVDTSRFYRNLRGYVKLTDISISKPFKIELVPNNPADFYDTTYGTYNGFTYVIDNTITPNQWAPNTFPQLTSGKVYYNNNEESYSITVPKGGVKYKVTITQICGEALTKNTFIGYADVQEGTPTKFLINGLDYNIIKDFNIVEDWTPGSDRATLSTAIGWFDLDNICYDINDGYDYSGDVVQQPIGKVRTKLYNRLPTDPLPSQQTISTTVQYLCNGKVSETQTESLYWWPKEYRVTPETMPLQINTYDHVPIKAEYPEISDGYIYYQHTDVSYNMVDSEDVPENFVFDENNTFSNIVDLQNSDNYSEYRLLVSGSDQYYYKRNSVTLTELYRRFASWDIPNIPEDVPIYYDNLGYEFDISYYYECGDENTKISCINFINSVIDMRDEIRVKMKDSFWLQDKHGNANPLPNDNDGGNILSVNAEGYDTPYTPIIKYSKYKDTNISDLDNDVENYQTVAYEKANIWYPVVTSSGENSAIVQGNKKLPYYVALKSGSGVYTPSSVDNTSFIAFGQNSYQTIKTKLFPIPYIWKPFNFRCKCWGETGYDSNSYYRIWDYNVEKLLNNNNMYYKKYGFFALKILNGIIEGEIENYGVVNFIRQELVNMRTNETYQLPLRNHRSGNTQLNENIDTEMRLPTRRFMQGEISELLNMNNFWGGGNLPTSHSQNPIVWDYYIYDDRRYNPNAEQRSQIQAFPQGDSDKYQVNLTHHYKGQEMTENSRLNPHLAVKINGSWSRVNTFENRKIYEIGVSPSINTDDDVTYYLMMHEPDYCWYCNGNGGWINSSNVKKFTTPNPYVWFYDPFMWDSGMYDVASYTHMSDLFYLDYDINTLSDSDYVDNSNQVKGEVLGLITEDLPVAFASSDIGTPLMTTREDYVGNIITHIPAYTNVENKSSLMFVAAVDNNSNTIAVSPLIDFIDFQSQFVIDFDEHGQPKKITLRIHRPSYYGNANNIIDSYRYYYPLINGTLHISVDGGSTYSFDLETSIANLNKSSVNQAVRWWEVILFDKNPSEPSHYTNNYLTYGVSIPTQGIDMSAIIIEWKRRYNGNCTKLYFTDMNGVIHVDEGTKVCAGENSGNWDVYPVTAPCWDGTISNIRDDGSTRTPNYPSN